MIGLVESFFTLTLKSEKRLIRFEYFLVSHKDFNKQTKNSFEPLMLEKALLEVTT